MEKMGCDVKVVCSIIEGTCWWDEEDWAGLTDEQKKAEQQKWMGENKARFDSLQN